MAPDSISAVELEFWSQFEEGIEVPRPLRIIKRSGTYTTSDGSIELDEGALVIPRRYSSRSISANTSSPQQEGPFGCLTIHKRRGRGVLSDMISENSPSCSFRSSSDQLLEELLSSVSSQASDWIEGSQALEFQGGTPSRDSMLFPQELATFHTIEDAKNNPFIRASTSPQYSTCSSSSSNTLRHSDHAKKSSFFTRPLFSFPKSKKSATNKQSQPTPTALRELNTSRLNTRHHKLADEIKPLSTKRSKYFRPNDSKENIRRHLSEEVRKAPNQFRDSFRRSSTVISLHNILRKLSLHRSASSRHMDPLPPVSSDTPTDTPTVTPFSTIKAGNMQIKLPQTPCNLYDLFDPAPAQAQEDLYGILGMNFDYEFDRSTPTNDNRLEWVLFKFYSTCQADQQPCHEFEGSEGCPFPARNQELPEAVAELKFEDRYCELVELRLPIIGSNSGPCSIRGVTPGINSRFEMRGVRHNMVFVVACLIRWRWPRTYLEDRIFATVITRWFSCEYPVRNVLSSRLDRPTVRRQQSDLVSASVSSEDLEEDEENSEEDSDSSTWSDDLYEEGWEMISGAAAVARAKDL